MQSDDDTTDGRAAEVRGLKAGDPQAIERLWADYFGRLVALARKSLPKAARRASDEEDIALSAFQSLCNGAAKGQFDKLDDRDDLWRLLVVITLRKARRAMRRGLSQKRGGGHVKGESVFLAAGDADTPAGLAEMLGGGPTPAFAAEVAEQCELLLDRLGDNRLRSIAVMKMDGYTVTEIAEELGCGQRSVERSLQLIRAKWSTFLAHPE
jgi:DNA-directed RNA polymerase specialized sigma24 family protein